MGKLLLQAFRRLRSSASYGCSDNLLDSKASAGFSSPEPSPLISATLIGIVLSARVRANARGRRKTFFRSSMTLGELRQTGAGLLDVQFGHFHVVGTRPGLGTSQGILRLAHPGVGVAHPGFRLIAHRSCRVTCHRPRHVRPGRSTGCSWLVSKRVPASAPRSHRRFAAFSARPPPRLTWNGRWPDRWRSGHGSTHPVVLGRAEDRPAPRPSQQSMGRLRAEECGLGRLRVDGSHRELSLRSLASRNLRLEPDQFMVDPAVGVGSRMCQPCKYRVKDAS